MNYLDTERVACGCKEPYVVMSVRSHIAIISFTAVITVTPKTKIFLSLRARAEREKTFMLIHYSQPRYTVLYQREPNRNMY